jgi:hypothetical protein
MCLRKKTMKPKKMSPEELAAAEAQIKRLRAIAEKIRLELEAKREAVERPPRPRRLFGLI